MTGKIGKRLIEVAFPLQQTSIDSIHEKTVRHGHISSLHLWPARRPLAASRAALIATLLPDPGDKDGRDEILRRMSGTIIKSIKKKKLPSGKIEEVVSEETRGGVLHWGKESGPDMDWFRTEIRKAFEGVAPKVLDPFAGGGAIPLEALRLGCDVTAIDLNPVAWFVLKCTLEYPQKLGGKKWRLPDFALTDKEFMTGYLKSLGLKPAAIRTHVDLLSKLTPESPQSEMFQQMQLDATLLDADFAWHVRAWGRWVLTQTRRELCSLYPTYAEFCALKPYRRVALARSNNDQLKLVSTDERGEPQIGLMNAGFDKAYLENETNPRWVAKPTAAYLWARTVKCKACRAFIPLLKTRWLAKRDSLRVVLEMQPNDDKSGVVFGINSDVKPQGGNPAQRREYDKKIGAGTMSRSGATCPCCGTIMTMEDIRLEGLAGKLASTMTAVVMEGPGGKEFRMPMPHELSVVADAESRLPDAFANVPFGSPEEPLPNADTLGFRVPLYGFDQWRKLFTPRQLVGLAKVLSAARNVKAHFCANQPDEDVLREAVEAYLVCSFSRLLDFCNMGVQWKVDVPTINHSFVRFALPITWDYAESNVIGSSAGSYSMCHERIATALDTFCAWQGPRSQATVLCRSATRGDLQGFDAIVTDPPYYDAIPYSDLMDFFYVWERRLLNGLSPAFDEAFREPLAPKWDHQARDGELIDDSSRFGGNKEASKRNYEDGMFRAFVACHTALKSEGRLVVVFAHKQPDAWETLVAAIIRAGFVVDGSWPIQTEQAARMRAQSSAALSSSVWLVCKKRSQLARAGWDAQVIKEMESNIVQRLREFWDAGIRGPDFVWAATGPALEAYSQYPAVKKASEPGALISVSEFLRQVRRIVVDFVVGRVLTRGDSQPLGSVSLDDVTTYYLLHRNDFGLRDAPAGACILYAVSCNLSERTLTDQYELLSQGKGASSDDDEGEDENGESTEELGTRGSGGFFKLRPWNQRKHRMLGIESDGGRASPLIDQVHKLMNLWKGGDVNKVNDYLDSRGLRRSGIFGQLLQALIELAPSGDEERSILESLSNHVRSLGATAQRALNV